MKGILVDPGASSSLIGARTLVKIQEEVLWPHWRDFQMLPAVGKRLSGIDGVSSVSPGRARMNLGVGPIDIDWMADVMRTDWR